ncbi:DUF2179 domain-containing protein [Paenibacillus eucommiae]|uniref:UPF0316 protein J2Z66_005326 n=1 Tax=Paenibacillus eucommiae TaxID=1355755 RepID=A0ABS4J341_9BACL|nr:DUF2179 domain-containing protein [Paenibacillus eucommiae]MBP1993700.1 uncharacterized protein YebE (UPF0316 family) [Paenibacillus eucommiae]
MREVIQINLTLIATIILINIVYVSFFTMRMIFVIRGMKATASLLSVAEVFIYLMGLNIVLSSLDKPWNIAAYCLGWGLGVYLGSIIEEKLALGYLMFQVIVDSVELELPGKLRKLGYGITSWTAEGMSGQRLVIQILAKRMHQKKLLAELGVLSPKAFVISSEPKNFKGGFWVKRLRD